MGMGGQPPQPFFPLDMLRKDKKEKHKIDNHRANTQGHLLLLNQFLFILRIVIDYM